MFFNKGLLNKRPLLYKELAVLLKQIFLLFCIVAHAIHGQTARMLQSTAPASSWELYSDQRIPQKKELLDSYIKDCKTFASQNAHIPTHTQNLNVLRVATYNIHFWCNPFLKIYNYAAQISPYTARDIAENFYNVINAIQDINSDILCLQEVLLFDIKKIKQTFHDMGYQYQTYFHEAQWDYSFGVMILSKYPFAVQPVGKIFESSKNIMGPGGEKRCYIKATISLPGDNSITIYTSHFDGYDTTDKLRYDEIDEILEDIQQAPNSHCLVCGDFNAVRFQDYQYVVHGSLVWDLLNRDNLSRTHFPTPIKALELFEQNKFQDCFAKANIVMPKFSVWNGTVVDFMFLNQQWHLPIDGCYFYYSPASDHVPVIMDCAIN